MSSIAFIRKDVTQQLSTARELMDAVSLLDRILKIDGLPPEAQDNIRTVQKNLGNQIDLLMSNVEQVQSAVIQAVRTSASR